MANSRENEARRLRVIVALNACRRDLGGLELAARWAARNDCDLEAWFVEEVNLFNVADLSFVKEVTRSSALSRDFDQSRVERAQRSCLAQLRQAIDRLNESSSVRASLRIMRGHLVRTVSVIDEGVAALVLSRRGEPRRVLPDERARKDRQGRAMPAAAGGAPVCVVVDGSEDSMRALRAATDIASSQQARLNVVFPENRPDVAEEARRCVFRSGHATDLSFRFDRLAPFSAPALLRYLRQSGCHLLVVKRSDAELLQSVAEGVECPLVLV